jgi:hypothetical protein
MNKVKLSKVKGKFIHTMGYSAREMNLANNDSDDESCSKTTNYLHPEEALYLYETVN